MNNLLKGSDALRFSQAISKFVLKKPVVSDHAYFYVVVKDAGLWFYAFNSFSMAAVQVSSFQNETDDIVMAVSSEKICEIFSALKNADITLKDGMVKKDTGKKSRGETVVPALMIQGDGTVYKLVSERDELPLTLSHGRSKLWQFTVKVEALQTALRHMFVVEFSKDIDWTACVNFYFDQDGLMVYAGSRFVLSADTIPIKDVVNVCGAFHLYGATAVRLLSFLDDAAMVTIEGYENGCIRFSSSGWFCEFSEFGGSTGPDIATVRKLLQENTAPMFIAKSHLHRAVKQTIIVTEQRYLKLTAGDGKMQTFAQSDTGLTEVTFPVAVSSPFPSPLYLPTYVLDRFLIQVKSGSDLEIYLDEKRTRLLFRLSSTWKFLMALVAAEY